MADKKDNPLKGAEESLSPEQKETLREHVRINSGGGIIELEPGDAAIVFRYKECTTRMPDIVIPDGGGKDVVSRVNACKVLFVLSQLNDGKALGDFGANMEEAYADFKNTVTSEELDNIVKYDSLPHGFIAPGNDEIH